MIHFFLVTRDDTSLGFMIPGWFQSSLAFL